MACAVARVRARACALQQTGRLAPWHRGDTPRWDNRVEGDPFGVTLTCERARKVGGPSTAEINRPRNHSTTSATNRRLSTSTLHCWTFSTSGLNLRLRAGVPERSAEIDVVPLLRAGYPPQAVQPCVRTLPQPHHDCLPQRSTTRYRSNLRSNETRLPDERIGLCPRLGQGCSNACCRAKLGRFWASVGRNWPRSGQT